MAESEFRNLQDANGDGVHDACADVSVPAVEPEPCPSCVPNPEAIVPNWIEQTEPFLNQKTCQYSVTIDTDYDGTGGDELESRMADEDFTYIDEAIERLLRFYNKVESRSEDFVDEDGNITGELGTVDALRLVANVSEYHLGGDSVLPRTGAKMKFLITVPAMNFNNIPGTEGGANENAGDTSSGPSIGDNASAFIESIELDVHRIKGYSRKARALLKRYTKYHAIFHQTEAGKLVFENGKPWNGTYYADLMKDAVSELFDFIEKKDFKASRGRGFNTGSGRKIADRITLGFSQDVNGGLKLAYVTITQNGCEEAANTFSCDKEKQTGLLAAQDSAWTDSVVVGYFSRLEEMAEMASAREPMPWKDFVIEYTNPLVSVSHLRNAENFNTCAAGDLNTGVKDGIEDFLGGVIDFSDIVSYKFAMEGCKRIGDNNSSRDTLSAVEERRLRERIFDEESKKTYANSMSACKDLPALLSNAIAKEGPVVENFWSDIADTLRNCGMYAIMFEAVACLMGGLSLDVALDRMLRAALKNMSMNHMEAMWAGLPYDKKAEINSELIRIYGSQDKPWRVDRYDATVTSTSPVNTRGTLGRRITESNEALIDAYIEAVFNVYADVDSLMELLTELDKFPGQEIIARVLSVVDCPLPPIFSPPLGDFFKDLDLSYCRNTTPITISEVAFENPFKNFSLRFDLLKFSFDLALDQLLDLIARLIIDLVNKLLSALCSILCSVTDLTTLAALATESTTMIQDMVGGAFCLEDPTSEDVTATIEELFGNFSDASTEQLQSMANESTIADLTTGMSSVLTPDELNDLINGQASSNTCNMLYNLVKTQYSEFLPAFRSPSSICNMFKNIGDLLPTDLKRDMASRLANRENLNETKPCFSICPTPDQLDDFEALRCSLLTGIDGTTEEQCEEQFQKLKDRTADDLSKLSDIAQKGIGQYISDALPNIGDGCDAIAPINSDEMSSLSSEGNADTSNFLQEILVHELIGRKGFLSYILSDTMGVPYTMHLSRARNMPFYYNSADNVPDWVTNGAFQQLPRGFFPSTVARWLQESLLSTDFTYSATNQSAGTISLRDTTAVSSKVTDITYENFGPQSSTELDYNSDFTAEDYEVSLGKAPDLTLAFSDNDNGDGGDPTYGFNIEYSESYVSASQFASATPVIKIFETSGGEESLSTFLPIRKSIDSDTAAELSNYSVITYGDAGEPPQNSLFNEILKDSWLDANISLPDVELEETEAGDLLSNSRTPSEIRRSNSTGFGRTDFNNINQRFINHFKNSIANNSDAFTFGYQAEDISREDLDYLDPNGNPYSSKNYPESTKVLGQSRMKYEQGEAVNRVHYLDPERYGGSYASPPLYISPIKKAGWLGLLESFVPEMDGCDPVDGSEARPLDILGLKKVNERVDEVLQNLPMDERLNANPDCVVEAPYARIFDRDTKSRIEGDVMTIIRTYILEEYFKGVATFNTYKLSFPEVFDNFYIDYVISVIEKDMKENSRRAGLFRDEVYFYAFLEQCVEIVDRMIKNEEVVETSDITAALNELNTVQQSYEFPYELEYDNAIGTELFNRKIRQTPLKKRGIKRYRRLAALQAVKNSEASAKVLMRKLVEREMESMIENISSMLNFDGNDLGPQITNIHKHFLGSSGLCLGSTLQVDLKVATEIGDVKNVASTIEDSTNISEYLAGETYADLIAELSLVIAGLLTPSTSLTETLATGDPKVARLYEAMSGQGTFVLEKYLYVDDPKQDLGISEDDYSLRGVVNPDTFKSFLDELLAQGFDMNSSLISDYFGDLSVSDGASTPVYSGETTEVAGHVHEYAIDENGNGVAYYAYPPEDESLRHQHEIRNFVVAEAYSPAAHQMHNHAIQYTESTDPTKTLSGTIGLRTGIRICYIPSSDFVQQNLIDQDLDNEEFLNQARLLKAYKFAEPSATIQASLTTFNAAIAASDVSLSLDSFKYMFPLVSYELDVLDQTFAELWNSFNLGTVFNLPCLVENLTKDPKYKLIFQHTTPIPTALSLMAIYNTKAFLPSLGQITNGGPNTGLEGGRVGDGEWEEYSIRSRNGLIKSPFDRWDQVAFEDMKKCLRSMFLSNYNSDDSTYEDENESHEFTSLGLKKEINLTNYSVDISFSKRRRLISRPFDKDGNEC